MSSCIKCGFENKWFLTLKVLSHKIQRECILDYYDLYTIQSYLPILLFKIALLRYNLHIEFTVLKNILLTFLVYFQNWCTFITNFRMFPHSQKKFIHMSNYSSFFPAHPNSFWWPLIYFVFQLICFIHKNESWNMVFCNCFSFIICFQSSPCYSIFLYFISFNTWIVFHCGNIAHLFIHSSVIRHLCCLYSFGDWLMLLSTFVYRFLWGHIFLFLLDI